MKFYETHFEEYIDSNQEINLHPKLMPIYKRFPSSINKFRNIIFYGPKGVGKYTQMLAGIKQYSPSGLKYEKKISVSYDKKIYFFKISDIHFEIDMSLLGCHSKMLWNEVYCQILDIISAKTDKVGIIVCKYFHEIHSELLEIFYSYMQTLNQQTISLKFILLTEELSFIPENIINCCQIISVPRPSKAQYNKCLKTKLKKDVVLDEITNIKNIQACITQLMKPYEMTCNKIINQMLDVDNLKFNKFRDLLYEIFIYDLDITDCIWFILTTLIERNKLNKEDVSDILIRTFTFLQYYNNNYRPIYHLENYIFYLISKVNGFSNSN
jgi:hypothetical protein